MGQICSSIAKMSSRQWCEKFTRVDDITVFMALIVERQHIPDRLTCKSASSLMYEDLTRTEKWGSLTVNQMTGRGAASATMSLDPRFFEKPSNVTPSLRSM